MSAPRAAGLPSINRTIRTLSVFCILLFVALLVNISYLQYWRADALEDDPRNRRVIQSAYGRERGTITAGGLEIAVSVPSADIYQYQRTYPLGPEYAPVTGFFSYFSTSGLESTQNSLLAGDDERLFVNRLVDLVTNTPPAGGNVELTIDPKVQRAGWDALNALGAGVQGAAVAIEPSTGRILAMVSTPSFDPNLIATHDLDASSAAYAQLDSDASQPMLNRTLQLRLPPGSTFKLITAAAAIEDLGYTPDTPVPGGTEFTAEGTTHTITNFGGEDCGENPTLTAALTLSCNTSFAYVGTQLSDDQLRSMAEAFGFDSSYFSDVPNLAQSVFPSGDLGAPLRAQSAIGQYDVAATPLQMAMVAATIANHGVQMKPYLVERVTSPELDVLESGKPTQLGTPISSRTADLLTSMMVSVVQSGTGINASIPGVTVAGKTGTAQSTETRPPYAWFTSFAPAENPKIAVAVLVQSSDRQGNEVTGGALSAPVARAMMEAVINP